MKTGRLPQSPALMTPPPKRKLKIILISTLIPMALLLWLFSSLHPLPPRVVTMATGPEGSSFETFAKRYKILLAKQGIELKLVPSQGAVDNLKLLQDSKSGVQVGFVMGGLAEETDSNELVSLGTIAYEPLWLFSHKITTDRGLFSLEKKRVSVGPEGSSSRAIVDQLLKKNAMENEPFQKLGLEPEQTEDALVKGQIDAAILVNSFASPVVRQLAKNPKIDMANFRRADAYVARFPFLAKVTIPEGAVDLRLDLPPHDTTLLATKTSLIVRGDLHPALQYLLLEAASQIHSRHGIFQRAGEFPSAETLEFPLSPDARHFYKSGKPFLQRYLPFWLAALVEQAIVLLLPVLGLMYPLIKGLTGLYGWGMQRRIFLLYGELHWVDSQIGQLNGKAPHRELLDRMKRLEDRANRVRVAQNYIPMLYDLKQSIATVKTRLGKKEGKS